MIIYISLRYQCYFPEISRKTWAEPSYQEYYDEISVLKKITRVARFDFSGYLNLYFWYFDYGYSYYGSIYLKSGHVRVLKIHTKLPFGPPCTPFLKEINNQSEPEGQGWKIRTASICQEVFLEIVGQNHKEAQERLKK
ncbi:hypothetical protein B9Z55_021785 [Caenorhabditis nigoni]|nr:hypothetical protein B9Z55_021785 [Caenorhabditis nigoni]